MRTVIAALAVLAFAAPAMAQNSGQIARAVGGSSCPGCNLFQAEFNGLQATGLDFSGARLRQADLSLTVLNRTRFNRSDMRDVNAYGAVFSSASFTAANLTNAGFVGAYLRGADFSGADMSGARGLTQSQLDRACGDGTTVLPGGLHIPPC